MIILLVVFNFVVDNNFCLQWHAINSYIVISNEDNNSLPEDDFPVINSEENINGSPSSGDPEITRSCDIQYLVNLRKKNINNPTIAYYNVNNPTIAYYNVNNPIIAYYNVNNPTIAYYNVNNPIIAYYNINNPMIAYYNVNSLRNKIHDLRDIISRSIPDILVLAETKIDHTFPNSQFLVDEYNEPTTNLDRIFWTNLIFAIFCIFLSKNPPPLPPSTMWLYAFHSFPRLALGVFMQKTTL